MIGSDATTRRSKSESEDSRAAPKRMAHAAMIKSVAGTVTPLALAPRARSYAVLHTSSSIGSSGIAAASLRRTARSFCPRAPFQSSSCTGGHQRACPDVSAASTRERTAGSPLGRSMCIQDEVSIRTTESSLPTHGLKLFWRDHVGTAAGVPDEFRHAHATVEVGDSTDYGFTFRLGLGELDCILKLSVGNINSGLHMSIIAKFGISEHQFHILAIRIIAFSGRHT